MTRISRFVDLVIAKSNWGEGVADSIGYATASKIDPSQEYGPI